MSEIADDAAITGIVGDYPVLLVGEVTPYGVDPESALHWPDRLRSLLGLSEDQYLGLHRVKLCVGHWSREQAKKRAFELLSPYAPWRVMVLLGRKVTKTFEELTSQDEVPFVTFSTRVCCPGMTLVSLPHPGGRNRIWNAPDARDRARQILRGLVPEIPWGSADVEGCPAIVPAEVKRDEPAGQIDQTDRLRTEGCLVTAHESGCSCPRCRGRERRDQRMGAVVGAELRAKLYVAGRREQECRGRGKTALLSGKTSKPGRT